MEIKRDRYLKKIISFMWDGQVKVITGIRRCGKSYLLRNLFKSYLLGEGVAEDHILSFELDLTKDIRYRNPLELASHVREIVEHSADRYYLFVDEIQMSDEIPNPYNPDGKKITFYDALNDLKSLSNLDIYVTGSNSKMLSSDFEQFQSTVMTTLSVMAGTIEMNFYETTSDISDLNGDMNQQFEAIHGFIRMIASGIVIGESSSNIKLKLENDILYFFTGDEDSVSTENAIAYFSAGKLYVNTVEILTGMKICPSPGCLSRIISVLNLRSECIERLKSPAGCGRISS